MKELLDELAASIPAGSGRVTMNKKDHDGNGWRPREFVLHRNMLFYYRPGAARPRAALCVDDCTVEQYRAPDRPQSFQITAGSSSVVLQAPDEQQMLMWMGSLQAAGYTQVLERANESDRMHSSMSLALSRCRQELDQSREKCRQRDEMVTSLDNERKQTAQLQTQLDELQAQIKEVQSGIAEQVEAAVREVQARADSDIKALQEELEQTRSRARVQLAVVEKERRHLEDVEEEEHAQLEETKAALTEHQAREAELESEVRTVVPRLESAVGALERSKEQLHVELEDATNAVRRHERTISELQEEVASLNRHLTAARETTTSASKVMNDELEAAKESLLALRLERDAERHMHHQQQQTVNESLVLVNSQIQVADRVLKEEREASQRLRAEGDTLREEIARIAAALQVERKHEEELQESNVALQAALERSEAQAQEEEREEQRRVSNDAEIRKVKARATALSETLQQHQQQLQRELSGAAASPSSPTIPEDFSSDESGGEDDVEEEEEEDGEEEARLAQLDTTQLLAELRFAKGASKRAQHRLEQENRTLTRQLAVARRASKPTKDGKELWKLATQQMRKTSVGTLGMAGVGGFHLGAAPSPTHPTAELHSEVAAVDPDVPPLTSGLLFKRGAKKEEESLFRKLQKWKQRLFVIERNSLTYYAPSSAATADDRHHGGAGGVTPGASMLGFVFLDGCEVRVPLAGTHEHQFMVHHPSRRTLHVYAESAEQMQRWVNGLTAAIERANAAVDVAELAKALAEVSPSEAPNLEAVMQSPALLELFHRFLTKERSVENLEFYQRVETFKKLSSSAPRVTVTGLAPEEDHWDDDEMLAAAQALFDEYVDQSSERMVNLPASLHDALQRKVVEEGEATADMFDAAQEEVFKLMQRDGFSRFCRQLGPREG